MSRISKNAIVMIIIGAACVAGLATVYFIQRSHYQNHFLDNTFINGWDYSNATVADVTNDLQDKFANYELVINERGGNTESITGTDLGLAYNDDGSISSIMDEQNADLWFMEIGHGHEYSVSDDFRMDEEKLTELVSDLECLKGMVSPKDAYVDSSEDKGYYVVEEVMGDELDPQQVYAVIKDAVLNLKPSVDLEKEELYKNPKIFKDDETLKKQVESGNKLLSANVTFDFKDRQYTADKKVIYGWMKEDKDGYTLVRDDVYKWVNQMAYETDTFGLERSFTTSTGENIMLAAGGDYGWCMDREATTDRLIGMIENGETATIEPDYLYTANDRGLNDIGGRYAEVCIESQMMWVYDNGELVVSTHVITGNTSTGFSTPSGSCWAIDGKKTDFNFSHFDGTSCSFWLPFNDEVGIHDATWNSAEAYNDPSYYLSGGSHGCVNTPFDAMSIVFDHLEIGDPVIVYYSASQVTGPEPTQAVGGP